MQKNELIRMEERIFRVLDLNEHMILLIDCKKRTMPHWMLLSSLPQYQSCSEKELLTETGMTLYNIDDLSVERVRFIREHFSMISDILPFVGDKQTRNNLIAENAAQRNISKRTVSNYLCLYLVYQNMSVFTPKEATVRKELSQDEKNMRWALNKFFYSRNRNSLSAAYMMMLKEKYCDNCGTLLRNYPSFHQFRYFYRKHKSLQTYHISRDGLKHYQRNNRPLLGDGVQEFASHVGVGMLDATVCDIYLVDDRGKLIGRPILTACIDGFSGLCCGYSLGWEGGNYSLRGLMLNVIADKVEHCRKHGIQIERDDWNCDMLPATLVTDKGSEYKSENFEQIAELGVTVINLPSYRPELKGVVEKFFDLVQSSYKVHLKGKGIIEPDYQERGAHDYRKDACLTMAQFETILLRCILYYNTKRVLENYPYTEDMLVQQVKPNASAVWNYGKAQTGCNLIPISSEQLVLTLLPRTVGKFSRNGLRVNKLRYKHDGYTERYLKGGTVTVSYNPDDVSCVWLIENGGFVRFSLIESRFSGKDLSSVQKMADRQKSLVGSVAENHLQAQIDLATHIQAVVSTASHSRNTEIKAVKETRKREQSRTHRDYVKENVL